MTKKIIARLLLFGVFFAFVIIPLKGFAIGFGMPFGGKVTSILPGLVCPGGVEVFTIAPVGLFPPGPYYISASSKRFKYFGAVPGRWILGLYDPIMKPCLPGGLLPVPVPAFELNIFGTSLR